MGRIITLGQDNDIREAPADAQRELQAAFPDCYYEWMNRAKRWSVKRKVPWEDVDRLAKEGKISQEDIDAFRFDRKSQGFVDDGDALIIHAFTVQDPVTGTALEPGSYVVEAMKRADTQNLPGGARTAVMDAYDKSLAHERELEKRWADEIDQAANASFRALQQNVTVDMGANTKRKNNG